jgi:hypothetical protein
VGFGVGRLTSAYANAGSLASISVVVSLPVKQKIIRRTSRMNGWQRAGEKPREISMISGEGTNLTFEGIHG